MTVFRIKSIGALALFLILLLPFARAWSQNDGRDASFVPVGSAAASGPPIIIAPSLAPITTDLPPPKAALPPPPEEPAPVAAAPVSLAPVLPLPVGPAPAQSAPAQPPVVAQPIAPPVVQAPTSPLPAPVPAPVAVTTEKPVAVPTPVVAPVTPAPLVTPVAVAPAPVITPAPVTPAPVIVSPATIIATPVESGTLSDINPESIGLLSTNDGGLGAGLWKGSPRLLVEQLIQALNLPTRSPTLNNLARLMLLTTASVPEGEANKTQSLAAMRIDKLVALGNAADAWRLAMLAKPEQMDDITLRQAAEAAMVSEVSADVCVKLPDIMKLHTNTDWQKLLLVCQLRTNDTKAAQLTLDVLHTQNIKDDILYGVAERNLIGGNKQLPRQLTPLKPLVLAVLQLTDLPLRDEVYARPEASLVTSLLKAKALNEGARIGLAERSASRGLLSATELASIYQGQVFTPENLANPGGGAETGPKMRALLYQATLQQKKPANRVNYVLQFYHSLDAGAFMGPMAELLANVVSDIQPAAEFNLVSATLARIAVVGGKADAAMAWLKQAHTASIGMPNVAIELQEVWPLTVFAGLESDQNYKADLSTWIDGMLKPTGEVSDMRAARIKTASIMLLLDADGFTVPDDQWGKIATSPEFEKRLLPPAFIMERLHAAGSTKRRGEAVLESLIALGGNVDPSVLAPAEAIRALRDVGLTADAGRLAQEVASTLSQPQTTRAQ